MEVATLTARLLAAMLFAVLDDEGVILVEQRRIGGEVQHEQRPYFLVPRVFRDHSEAG